MAKKWYQSKTIWANIIALAAVVASTQFGFDLSGEETAAVLAVINLILRIVTKQPLSV